MVTQPEKNKDTGEWEVFVDTGTYSFTEEADARQFYNLQLSFVELQEGEIDGQPN